MVKEKNCLRRFYLRFFVLDNNEIYYVLEKRFLLLKLNGLEEEKEGFKKKKKKQIKKDINYV